MCNPMMLAVGSLAIGAGQAIVQHQGQQAQYEAQESRYQQNRMNAIRDFQERNKSANMRIAQEDSKASEERFETSMQARQARGTNEARAASMSIYGNTVDTLMADIMSSEDRAFGRIDTNQGWSRAQMQSEKRGMANQTQQRIASVPRGTPPNFGALMLNIGSSALNAGSSYYQNTRRT